MPREFLAILLFLAASCGIAADPPPRWTYLTWSGPTETTMTVNFHILAAEASAGSVRWWTDGEDPAKAEEMASTAHKLAGIGGRWIHHAKLTGLRPGGLYAFQARSVAGPWSAIYRFRTVAADGTPLRFVAGGDIGSGMVRGETAFHERAALLRQAAAREPQFAILGGDYAYFEGGKEEGIAAWDGLFEVLSQNFVAAGNRLIPMVLAIGNHELTGGSPGGKADKAPFYYSFFAQEAGTATFVRRFGPRAAVVVLDSGHTATHAEQAVWLDRELTALAGIPLVMASYHVPLYPSVRPFGTTLSVAGRAQWLSIFDRHHLAVAFEHHDHAFKRSHPLRDGLPVEPGKGTLYLGDGSLGIGARGVSAEPRPYLARSAGLQHVWFVEETPAGYVYRAIASDGTVFDVLPQDHPEAAAAARAFAALTTRAESFTPSLAQIVVDPGLGGSPLGVKVTNPTAGALDARLTLVAEGKTLWSGRSAVAAGATVPLVIDQLVRPERGEFQLAFDYDLPVPRRIRETVQLSLAEPRRLTAPAGAIVIDGNPSEAGWANQNWSEAMPPRSGVISRLPGLWRGPDDLSFSLAMACDGERLLLAVRVRDDQAAPTGRADPWESEGLELRLDARAAVVAYNHAGEADLATTTHRTLLLTPDAARHSVMLGRQDTMPAGSVAAISPIPGGYAIEVAVPLAGLVAVGAPRPVLLRVNLAVDDQDPDDQGQVKQVSLYTDWRNPGNVRGSGLVVVP